MTKNGCFEIELLCKSCSNSFKKYVRVYDTPNFYLLKLCPTCGESDATLVDYWYKNSIKGKKKVKLQHCTKQEWSDGGQGMVYGNIDIHLGYGVGGKVLFYSDPINWIHLL